MLSSLSRLDAVICSTNHVHNQGSSGTDRPDRPDDPGLGTALRRRLPEPDRGRLPALRRRRHRAPRVRCDRSSRPMAGARARPPNRIATPGLDLASVARRGDAAGARTAASPHGRRLATADVAVSRLPGRRPALDIDGMERRPRRSVRQPSGSSWRWTPWSSRRSGPSVGRGPRATWTWPPSMPRARRSGAGCRASSMRRAVRWTQARVLVGMPPGGPPRARSVRLRRRLPSGGPGGRLSRRRTCRSSSWLRLARETAAPAIVLGAVTREDAAAVDAVVDAIRTMDRPPVCFTGGPASLEATLASGAVRLPSSLDEAVSVVAR